MADHSDNSANSKNPAQDFGSDESNHPLIRDGVASYLNDQDPEETREWMDSLDGLLENASSDRARYLMLRLRGGAPCAARRHWRRGAHFHLRWCRPTL